MSGWSVLKHVAIILIRVIALGLCLSVSFFPKPVPTFGRHALEHHLAAVGGDTTAVEEAAFWRRKQHNGRRNLFNICEAI